MSKTNEKDIFVFIDRTFGAPADVSLELLGEGRRLAKQLGARVSAVVLGEADNTVFKALASHGAERIVHAAAKELNGYTTLCYARALAQIATEQKPEIFLFGATATGRDVAPRISARLRTGLTADCTALVIDEETGNMMMTRPAFGGNIMATIACADHRPQMATVRPGVMLKTHFENPPEPEVVPVGVTFEKGDNAVEVIETVARPRPKLDIRQAKVLVSGGRGMGGPENFAMLQKVADELGGTVSASRAAVDAGWVDKAQQVGQTGSTVRPDLYIACGISGAVQHVAGMEESGFIIAVNKDSNANIFGVADLGIVGDWKTVLPALVKELSQVKKG